MRLGVRFAVLAGVALAAVPATACAQGEGEGSMATQQATNTTGNTVNTELSSIAAGSLRLHIDDTTTAMLSPISGISVSKVGPRPEKLCTRQRELVMRPSHLPAPSPALRS